MDEHQARLNHTADGSVGISQSPFVYHSSGSLNEQTITHYDSSLHRQQQMHQHIAAVSHMQQTAQVIPQMIHITGQHIQQLQDQSFQYFQQVPLQNAIPIPRVEDMQRPAGMSSYPINAIFVTSEDKNCCLKDRGTRCSRPAGTAGFTHRIRELVSRSGALLTEDATAGHQYICDHHKNYIQKLRVVGLPPGSYVQSSLAGVHSFFPPMASFLSPYSVESLMDQHPSNSSVTSEPEDFATAQTHAIERSHTPNRGTVSVPFSAITEASRRKDHPEAYPTAVDMRKVSHAAEVRNLTVSVSPEKESSGESSGEEYDGGPASSDLLFGLGDLNSMEDLINYVKHFEIDIPSHPTQEELCRLVCEHMDTVPVNDVQSTLTNFFHAVKSDMRPFNQPYKQALNVDFDLSSDEEMMLIDGKNGALNGDVLSGASDGHSDSDDDDGTVDDGLADIQFDAETQRALTEINGKLPVAEIERILGRYSLPIKHSFPAHESDTESSSSDERKPVKRPNGAGKKRPRMRNSDD